MGVKDTPGRFYSDMLGVSIPTASEVEWSGGVRKVCPKSYDPQSH